MPTLPALLAAGAARRPEGPAVTDGIGTLDWAQFTSRVAAIAGQLRATGVMAGDRVALWLPNSADYLAVIFACAQLGAIAVHINTRFRASEVGALLARSRAGLLVTEWGFPAVDFPAVFAGIAPAERPDLKLVIGRHLPEGTDSIAGLPAQRLVAATDAPARASPNLATPNLATPDMGCLTFTTSGTTSGPKLVLHTQRSIAHHAQDIMRAMGLDVPGSAMLAAVPFCGTFGNAAAMAAIAGGAHVVCMDRFDADMAVRLIRDHAVTHSAGGDDMLGRLVTAAEGEPFTTMRLFGYAAFHSTAAATAAAAAAIGLAPAGVYGSSEMQALFALSEGAHRLRNGGRPVSPATEISVRDPESGAILPHGQSGELCFRAPSRFAAYLEDDAATARAMTADGFFRSGDLGRLDGDSFVYEARLGDTLRLGGFLVTPEEIEAFIVTLPGVAGAQVVAARKDADIVPVAFVTAHPRARLEEAELLAQCRNAIARFKVPARIAVLAEFPTTDSPNGRKIQRVRLREMATVLLQESAA
jgi:fatty-acyl-CoA synthase